MTRLATVAFQASTDTATLRRVGAVSRAAGLINLEAQYSPKVNSYHPPGSSGAPTTRVASVAVRRVASGRAFRENELLTPDVHAYGAPPLEVGRHIRPLKRPLHRARRITIPG